MPGALYGKLGLSAENLQKAAANIPAQIAAVRFAIDLFEIHDTAFPSKGPVMFYTTLNNSVEIAKAVMFLACDESACTAGSEPIIAGAMGT